MDDSPSSAWKRPSDIMRLHQRRKSLVKIKRASLSGSPQTLGGKVLSQLNPEATSSTKRRNPFGCCPGKRANLGQGVLNGTEAGNKTENDDKESFLLGILDGVGGAENKGKDMENLSQQASQFRSQMEEVHKRDEQDSSQMKVEEDKQVPNPIGHPTFPVDWSLRTKLRFVSDKSFSWCTPLKTPEESAGLSAFLKCSPDPQLDTDQDTTKTMAAKSTFKKHCLYWVHPNLPWVKVFPRIVSEAKLGKPGIISHDEQILKSLLADWTDSFTSVFHTFRSGRCPYFYLCTHQQTVLFRNAGVGGVGSIHALITPTTRGFREALKNEDIEFSLPLISKKTTGEEEDKASSQAQPQSDSANSGTPAENSENPGLNGDRPVDSNKTDEGDDEDDIDQTDEGASSWLESMGLDTSSFRSLDPNKVKLTREGFRAIDHRPESLVLVEGPNTQAFFNYLLNCRSCIANTGIQMGIPPTILAPTAFTGATMKPLKVKASSVHQQQAGRQMLQAFVLEVVGPVLPHTIHGLNTLLSQVQGSFSSTYSVHEPTTPFNGVPVEDTDCTKKSTGGDFNVQEDHWESVVKGNDLGKQALRELSFSNGLFNWMS